MNKHNYLFSIALPSVFFSIFSWFISEKKTVALDSEITVISQSLSFACDRERDSLALIALYNSTDGPNWDVTWDLMQPIDTWYGVSLNDEGCVTCLDLDGEFDCNHYSSFDGNNLQGQLPEEIGNLSNLVRLYLSGNNLGQLPETIGNLTNLKTLFIAEAQLTGTIPVTIGNLVNITSLILDNNMLTGTIPPCLSNLVNADTISFIANSLQGCYPIELSVFCGFSEKDPPIFIGNDGLPDGGNFNSFLAFCEDGTGACESNTGGCEIQELSCRERDSLALVALWEATHENGPWTNEWDLNMPMDTWFGVTLNEDGCVTCLDLDGNDNCVRTLSNSDGNNLSGTLPVEITNLSELVFLNLSNNPIGDTIPVELEKLNKLELLWFSGNKFSGEIPIELSNLANLKSLILDDNQLTGGIPSELGNLVNLSGLGLSKNNLTGSIPPELGNLINLNTNLNLSQNQLTGSIPPELGNLNNLLQLWLFQNNLNGSIPPELGKLNKLTSLFLSNNALSGFIPIELGMLGELEDLFLENNSLSGSIPVEIGNLLNLNRIQLQNNQLNGEIPTEFGNFTNLTELRLNTNHLEGIIPSELGNLSKLINLWLDNNQFTGDIPAELGNLPSLIRLRLQKNRLTGKVPKELGNLTALIALLANENQLDGCFPIELNVHCDISYNFSNNPALPWEGEFERFCNDEEQIGAPCDDGDPNTENDVITEECGCAGEAIVVNECRERDSLELVRLYNIWGGLNWTYEEEVYLRSNFNGFVSPLDIPNSGLAWNFNMPIDTWHGIEINDEGCVISLFLNNNGLIGDLDDISLLQLENLYLSSNQISGALVDFNNLPNLQFLQVIGNNIAGNIPDFSNLPNLTSIELGNNQLTGSIPDFSNFSNLKNLSINDNELTGSIPDFSNLPNLVYLNKNNNQITGTIPNFSTLNNLAYLELRGNQIEGTIPSFLNLPNLIRLDLSRNQLSGNIPIEIGNLVKLEGLGLSINNLTGVIPQELGNLINLKSLSISNNQLAGSFPKELGQLSNLTNLSLKDNNLEGALPTEIAGLQNLLFFDLDNNNLSNAIPSEIGLLQNLRRLRLHSNQFSGKIPKELGELNNLERLYLNNNKLTDCFIDELMPFCTLDFGEDVDNNQLGYNFTNNPALPWQGDFSRFCAGEDQIGAPCDDGNPNTENDVITEECGCAGAAIVMNECRERDSLALVALWNATHENGPWTNEWDLSMPVDTWFGVTLNEEGCVSCLDLDGVYNCSVTDNPGNNLMGLIPSELGKMVSLRILGFRGNQLTGNIPTEIGNLQSLTNLNLGSNQLTGIIPKELSQLINLTFLEIANNQLTGGIPTELSQLDNLKGLYLVGNQLTGNIPIELGQLSNLTTLSIGRNLLSGNIPVELAQLSNLQFLFLNNNQLEGNIPIELGLLNKLRRLYLYNNKLTGELPPNFSQLENLTELNLADNQLSGFIPIEFRQLKNLERLELHNNELTGKIPEELRELLRLTRLTLNNNNLIGSIPDGLGQLTNLTSLLLQSNNLTGCFSDSLFKHCDLGFLSNTGLGYNFTNNPTLPWQGDFSRFCTGEEQIGAPCDDGDPNTENDIITEECGCAGAVIVMNECRERDSLALVALWEATHENGPWTNEWDLSMPMDSWFGVSLNEEGCVSCLDLDGGDDCAVLAPPGNNLAGPIPTEIGNLLNLTKLFLTNNNLTKIPSEIGKLEQLQELWLGSNQLNGSIPVELGDLTNLLRLSLGVNQLSGNIPSELANLKNLTYLFLTQNQLSGTIPVELGQLTNLTELTIDRNQISGGIPSELGNLIDLTRLELSDNQLMGNIPAELGNLSNLTILKLHNNLFSDCFPNELMTHCSLDFSNNNSQNGYNFFGNPALPWQGDFSRFCAGEEQIGAPCDDEDSNTQNDQINENCECKGIDPCATETNGAANAGENTLYCENETIVLAANQPQNTTGQWTSPTGATILSPTEITTEITNLVEGENLLVWILSTTECGEYDADTVIISYALGMPQVQADSFTTFLERDFDASVITNDQLSEVAEWELTVITPPTKGTLMMNPDGSFNYNPNAEYCGTDYFEYEICNVLCPDFCDVARVDLNVILEEDNSIVAPNVITPNGDKYNEYFIIPQLYANPTNYPDNEFMVVNQWGDVVYEKDNYQNDWNGVNNTGKELPQATYYYVFDFGDGREKIAGKVVILK